jgi:hypothetical protein
MKGEDPGRRPVSVGVIGAAGQMGRLHARTYGARD